MNKEIIEKYITFGIDNGFKDLDGYKFLGLKYEIDHILGEFETANGKYYLQLLGDSILDIITSKEFIEAIARGVNIYKLLNTKYSNRYDVQLDTEDLEEYENDKKEHIELITHKQADVIRDCKLEEFINNLLK